MMDLIKACETESELDFLQKSFVLTDERKEAVLQQRIIIWTNAMADDIEQGNVFDGLMAKVRQRCPIQSIVKHERPMQTRLAQELHETSRNSKLTSLDINSTSFPRNT